MTGVDCGGAHADDDALRLREKGETFSDGLGLGSPTVFLREDRVTLIRLGDQDVERVLGDRQDDLEAVVLVSHIGGADAEYRHNLKRGCHAEHALLVLDKVGAEDVDTENDESTCAVVAKVDPRPSDPESHHDTLDGQLVGNVPCERAHQEVAENDKSSRSVALVHEDLLLGAHIIIEVGGRQNHFPCILEVTDRALDDIADERILEIRVIHREGSPEWRRGRSGVRPMDLSDDRWRRPMDLSDGRRRKPSDGREGCHAWGRGAEQQT